MQPSKGSPLQNEAFFTLEELAEIGAFLLSSLFSFVVSRYRTIDDLMDDLAAFQHWEAMQANGGISFGSAAVESQELAEPWTDNQPIPGIDYVLVIPHVISPATLFRLRTQRPVPIQDVVRRLLSPPPHAFVNGTLSIRWVIGAAGYHNFEFRKEDERWVLKKNSELRARGELYGLPRAFSAWLSGDDPDYTAAEEGMILTPEFFEKEVD